MSANQAQIVEILSHKWLESEKMGHDIGINAAAVDWISKYAEKFRQYWEEKYKNNEQ